MATGKWIQGLTAQTPVADAARQVLTVRLDVIRKNMESAVHEPEKDSEYVHQFRVGTRRSAAALDIFADWLPKKRYRIARKYLKKLRRAAGGARDWDVFLLDLTKFADLRTNQRAAVDFLMGYAAGQRAAAQPALVSNVDVKEFDDFRERTLNALRSPAESEETVLIDLARPFLAKALQDLEDAASLDLYDYENLHQARIVGKRLRYAMEVFAPCFSDTFRKKYYKQVEDMQEILGEANDSSVALARLDQIKKEFQPILGKNWTRLSPGLSRMYQFHQQRLPEQRDKFIAWWTDWHQTGKRGLSELVRRTYSRRQTTPTEENSEPSTTPAP